MKGLKYFLVFIISFSFNGYLLSQVAGTIYIPSTNYPYVKTAIDSLNVHGVGAGGVIFNVIAGHTETNSRIVLNTTTSSSANAIVFQKFGAGANPLITAGTGTGSLDGIIMIEGTDFVTFDGIDLKENASSNDATAQMEWGYAILKAGTNNGSRFITIKNCNIGLRRLPNTNGTYGIYSANHTSSSIAELTINDTLGTNSFLKIYSNTIDSAYKGIHINGYNHTSSPYRYYDHYNEIGVEGGNKVNNVGNSTSLGDSYGIYARYQDSLKVYNNVVDNDTLSSGNTYGIYLDASSNASAWISKNSISIKHRSSNYSLYGIYVAMGDTVSGTRIINIITVDSNTIENSYANNGAYSGTFYGINVNSRPRTVKVSGNTVRNNTIPGTGYMNLIYIGGNPTFLNVYDNLIYSNRKTGSSGYMYCITGRTSKSEIYRNKIYNDSIPNSSGTSQMQIYGIYNNGSPVTEHYNDNEIHNLGISGTNTNGNNFIRGIMPANASASDKRIHGNKIYNLTMNLSGVTGGAVNGIYNNSSDTTLIFNNRVFSLYASAGAYNWGIYLGNPSHVFAYNNYVYNLYNPTASRINSIYGIHGGHAVSSYIYNNTIYLDASSSSTSFGSAGIYITTTSISDIRNNIIINKSVPGAGSFTAVSACLSFSSTSLTNYAAASDRNNFYAGSTSDTSRAIFFDGTNKKYTLNTFKSYVNPREINSVTENTIFKNTLTEPYDVRPDSTISTLNESGGATISLVTTDADSIPRYPNPGYPENSSYPATAPDIGADEFGGIPGDKLGPSITYTQLSGTTSTSNRILSVNIKDATGVPLTGTNLPRIYFRKFYNGIWYSTSGNKVSGTNKDGNWEFTINNTLMGGITQGDSVDYFVIAQDITDIVNIAANPGTGIDAENVNNINTYPSNPNKYNILSSFTGTFYVGAGQTYPTLTAAVNDYNTRTITGPVDFFLVDTLYGPNENFPITIKRNPGASSNNALWIHPFPSDKNVRITGRDTSDYKTLIRFQKAAYVKLSGYSFYDPGRHITIMDSSGGRPITIGSIDTSTNYVTVEYCNLITPRNYENFSENQYGVYIYGNNYGTTIQNNEILKSQIGIYLNPFGEYVNKKFNISGNIIGSRDTSKRVIKTGLSITHADSCIISRNEILETNDYGINIEGNYNTIEKNIIHEIGKTSESMFRYGGKGIYIEHSFNVNVINNSIYGITGIGSDDPQYAIAGIFLGNFVSAANVYYNSVNLQGNIYKQDAVTDKSYALYSNVSSAFNLKNNILVNSIQNVAGNSSAYSFYNASSVLNSYYSINYNNYYVSGNQGVLCYHNGNRTTLSEWKNATGKDSNSFSEDPYFLADTNLQLTDRTNLYHTSTPIPYVFDDITGLIIRHPSTPTIGAYENFIEFLGPQITYSLLPNSSFLTHLLVLTNFAVITDISDVETLPGLSPRFYYKRNYDTNAFIGNYSYNKGWKYVEASGTTSPFSFTIDYGKLYNNSSGVMKPGDIVEYFVTAQDKYYAGSHVSSNPQQGFIGTSVANISSAPVPNHYAIVNVSSPLSGNYDVGLEAFNLATGKKLYHKNINDSQNKKGKDKNGEYEITGIYEGDNQYKGPLKVIVNENSSKMFSSSVVYATLSGAIEDLKENGISGSVIFYLSDTSYTSELFPLLIDSVKGSNDTSTIKIKPKTGIKASIIGSNQETLFDFSKAKRIILDGANTSGGTTKNLTIINYDTNGCVIRFRDNSSFDTVKNCIIKGGSRSYQKGVIYFGGTTAYKGSSDNLILNCDIGNSSKSPYNAVYSINTQSKYNYNLSIINCNIYNWSDYGINLSDTSASFKHGRYLIQGNSFYYNMPDTPAVSQTAIYIIPNNFGDSISNNYIGGTLPECGGNYWANKSDAGFTGIHLPYQSNKNAFVNINRNTITNILLNRNTNSYFKGIFSFSGCDIKGNLIGSNIQDKGVKITGTDTINIGSTINGIYVHYEAANSVYNRVSIDSNIITNLLNTSKHPGTVTGIYCYGNPPDNFVTGNRIYNIGAASNSQNNSSISGIHLELYESSVFNYDTTVVSNNMISLGYGITNNNEYYGINDKCSGNREINICDNTLYIGGISNGNSNSQVYFHNNISGINILNNIFYNERSGGSGNHLCIFIDKGIITVTNYNMYVSYMSVAAANWKGSVCGIEQWKTLSGGDKNSYYYTSADALSSSLFTDVVSGILSIINSNSVCWYSASKGCPLTYVSSDYFGNVRSVSVASGPVCIGANEFIPACSPASLIPSGPPISGDTTFYTQSGQNVLNILWGESGKENKNPVKKEIENQPKKENKLQSGALSWRTVINPEALPTTVNVQKYSGAALNEADTTSWINSAKRGAGYWKVTVDVQPSSPFSVTLYFGDEELGSISDPANNLILTKFDPNNHTWTPFPRTTDAGANWSSYVDWANRTVTVKGLTDFGGTSLYSEFALTDQTAPLSKMKLDLTALIQGYYNGTTMVSSGATVEIRSSASPYTLVDQSLLTLSTAGQTAFYSYSSRPKYFTGSVINYYIVIKHLNCLETWSATAQPFNNVTGVMSYDFTTAQTQALGSLLALVGTKWCIVSGDVNQDGFLNKTDYDEWNNYVLSGLTGGLGVAADLNADGFVNTTDYELWYNNFLAGYTKVVPSLDKLQLKNIQMAVEKNQQRINKINKKIRETDNKNVQKKEIKKQNKNN